MQTLRCHLGPTELQPALWEDLQVVLMHHKVWELRVERDIVKSLVLAFKLPRFRRQNIHSQKSKVMGRLNSIKGWQNHVIAMLFGWEIQGYLDLPWPTISPHSKFMQGNICPKEEKRNKVNPKVTLFLIKYFLGFFYSLNIAPSTLWIGSCYFIFHLNSPPPPLPPILHSLNHCSKSLYAQQISYNNDMKYLHIPDGKTKACRI